MLDNKRRAYVYKFISITNRVLYVGKTVNLNNRMRKHWSKKSHLPKELYSQVQRIEYIVCADEYEALHKELEYITYYKPPYNKMSKIRQCIAPPQDLHKWKLYKTIKHIPKKQELINRKQEKYMPLVLILFYILIILGFVYK